MRRWFPALSLLLLAGALGACGPAFRASAAAEARLQGQRYQGVWALVDDANNLFNGRLRPDGRATAERQGRRLD